MPHPSRRPLPLLCCICSHIPLVLLLLMQLLLLLLMQSYSIASPYSPNVAYLRSRFTTPFSSATAFVYSHIYTALLLVLL